MGVTSFIEPIPTRRYIGCFYIFPTIDNAGINILIDKSMCISMMISHYQYNSIIEMFSWVPE